MINFLRHHRILLGVIAMLTFAFFSFPGSAQAFNPSVGENVEHLLNNPAVTGFNYGIFNTGNIDSAGYTTGYGYFSMSLSFKDGRSWLIAEHFHCISPTLANPSNKTYYSWSAKVTKIESGRAYIGIKINTDSWAQNLYGVISTPVDVTTTYTSHTTANVDDSKYIVKSGWDDTKTGSYNIPETQNSIKITFTHEIKRTDNEGVTGYSRWRFFGDGDSQLKGISAWQPSVTFAAYDHNSKTLNTGRSTYTISLGKGDSKILCQGVDHDKSYIVSPTSQPVSPSGEGRSRACVSIHRPETKTPPSPATANTSLQYIGEVVSGVDGDAYFWVDSDIKTPDGSRFQVLNGDDTPQKYHEGEKTDSGNHGFPNWLCNHFSISKSGCTSTRPSVISDDDREIGKKICAIPGDYYAAGPPIRQETRYRTIIDIVDGQEVKRSEPYSVDIYEWFRYVKNASCSPVVKKPNVRFTNGNIFASGNITTSDSPKVASGNNVTYGSWGEYLAIANGSISSKFGSGASLRFNNGTTNTSAKPLMMISNTSNQAGYAGISSASSNFINRIKSRFQCGSNYDYVEVICGDDININNQFVNKHDLNNTNQLHIIIAKNIDISEFVTTINAWLIADNTINTCAGYELREIDINKCNQSLTINGIAYAKNFKLHRIAGANAGLGERFSAQSAEIFNLTPTSFGQAYRQAASGSQKVTEVYLQELAPRV